MHLHLLNGPNLNMLGSREPHIYGSETWADIEAALQARYPDLQFSFFQSNWEGALVDKLQQIASLEDAALIINAGALSHYSYALHDALKLLTCPKIEVHLSQTAAREPFRHHSVLSAVCDGTISGFGKFSYFLAVEALLLLKKS